MTRLRASDEIEVALGSCECEGEPHEQDTAWLPATIDPWDAAEAVSVIFSGEEQEVVERKVARIFVRRGRWNCTEPYDPDKMAWATLRLIANAASEQYTEELLAPFQPAPQKSSRRGQTGGSTSASKPST
jgi:hypothetical protein